MSGDMHQCGVSSPVEVEDFQPGEHLLSFEISFEPDEQERVSPNIKQSGNSRGKLFCCTYAGCQKSFRTAFDLNRHCRTHTGCKPFQCTYAGCSRKFSTADNRKVHMRQHTGERPYVCHVSGCGRSFTSQTNLKNHDRTHTGERPYCCSVQGCGKRFAEYSTLHKHETVHRNGQHRCHKCQRKFRSQLACDNHTRRHHKCATAVASTLASSISTQASSISTQASSISTETNSVAASSQQAVSCQPGSVCCVADNSQVLCEDKIHVLIGNIHVHSLQPDSASLLTLPSSHTPPPSHHHHHVVECPEALVIASQEINVLDDAGSSIIVRSYRSAARTSDVGSV